MDDIHTIEAKLNRLAMLQAEVDARRLQFDELRRQVLGPEITQKLEELDIEQVSATKPLLDEATQLSAEIKNDVLTAGATVKGAHLQAVYYSGKETADIKGLKGYAVAHPEAAKFIRKGDPYVTIK